MMVRLSKGGITSHLLDFDVVENPMRDQLSLQSDQIALLSFREDGGWPGHMVLLLAVNSRHKALIFDPNDNWSLVRTQLSELGKMTNLDFYQRLYGKPVIVTGLMKVRIHSLHRLTNEMIERIQK